MLKVFLWANAASCFSFGAIFVTLSTTVVVFIGDPPVFVIFGLGVLLLINAVLLVLATQHWSDRRAIITFFVLGDAGWVIFTAILLALGVWINGTAAIATSIIVAGAVGGLGFGQYYFGLRSVSQIDTV